MLCSPIASTRCSVGSVWAYSISKTSIQLNLTALSPPRSRPYSLPSPHTQGVPIHNHHCIGKGKARLVGDLKRDFPVSPPGNSLGFKVVLQPSLSPPAPSAVTAGTASTSPSTWCFMSVPRSSVGPGQGHPMASGEFGPQELQVPPWLLQTHPTGSVHVAQSTPAHLSTALPFLVDLCTSPGTSAPHTQTVPVHATLFNPPLSPSSPSSHPFTLDYSSLPLNLPFSSPPSPAPR